MNILYLGDKRLIKIGEHSRGLILPKGLIAGCDHLQLFWDRQNHQFILKAHGDPVLPEEEHCTPADVKAAIADWEASQHE
jgi:hypothetical protein